MIVCVWNVSSVDHSANVDDCVLCSCDKVDRMQYAVSRTVEHVCCAGDMKD